MEEKKYTEALKELYKAASRDQRSHYPFNWNSKVDECIVGLGKNPHRFEDRIELGAKAELSDHFEGAITEYRAALKLKFDSVETHEKLGKIYQVMHNSKASDDEFEIVKKMKGIN